MFKHKIISAGFIFALAVSLNAEARLCKWVDEHGDIHYGDAIPREYLNKDANQPNAEARSKCDEDAKMSPEMIRAKEEEAAKNLATKKEMEEKKRRVNALRNTYSSEKEIDLALERNSALINARIDSYNVQLKSSQNTLDDLKTELDNRSREGRQIPQSLYDDISVTEARVARLQSERAKSEEELKSMKARFEDDKILYRKIILLPANDAENNPYPYATDVNEYPDYSTRSRRARKSRSRSSY